MYLSRATCESMDRAEFRRKNPTNKDGTYVWPPKNYVWGWEKDSKGRFREWRPRIEAEKNA